MMLGCRLLGHKLAAFPTPLPEWRILGHYAALVDIYRCLRCGEAVEP